MILSPSEVPSQCGRPTILDWTPSFVDLSWTGPSSDGGARISEFSLEMKETTMRDWAENCVIKVSDLEREGEVYRGRCENLEEEYQYRFRVVAINKAGKSQPGPSSDTVVAMHKNISPFLKVIIIASLSTFVINQPPSGRGNPRYQDERREASEVRCVGWRGASPHDRVVQR